MNLYNLFEDNNRTPNPNYAEELAYQIFKAAPDLDTTGAADEVLDYAYDLVVNDFGKTKANALFAYDEDFDSDLVNAYLDLQMNQQAVDKKQVNEVDPRNFDSDEDYYAALNAPAKRRSAPSDYPYSPEEDDAYFREIFRKKREAAKKSAQDKATGVAESKKKVNESVFLKEDRERLHEQWSRVGQRLVEYKLTPDQIQDIFSQVEKTSTQAGGNRTLAGRGVDKATELNAAWEELKGQIQRSRPVKGFDDLYDTAAAKLKTATGGDEGVMQYVNKYRDFAKKHPYIQSAVYAALIAAAGLSGAGLGGAGALGLLKMTDRLLQGDKASSALYKGAKTGALAMAAHSIADYFKNPNAQIPTGTPARLPDGSEYVVQKGDTLSAIAQKNGVSVKDLMAANSGQTVPGVGAKPWGIGWEGGEFYDPIDVGTMPTQAPNLTNPDVLTPGQKINVPGSLGPTQTYADGVGTAADTWDKVKSGAYTPSEISRNQAAKWNLPGAGEYTPTGGSASNMTPPSTSATDIAANAASSGKPALTPKGDEVDYASSKTNPWDRANAKVDADVAQSQAAADAANAKWSAEYSDWLAKNPNSPVAYDDEGTLMPGWVDDPEKPGFVKFNAPKLKESQIYTMFDSVVAGQKKLNEGMWDSVKGAAARAGQWAQTKGHNLTTKITLDKLLQAWNKANKTTDSEELIKKVLLPAGVSPEVINSVYTSMKIPTAPAQQTGVPGRVEPTMTAAPAAQQTGYKVGTTNTPVAAVPKTTTPIAPTAKQQTTIASPASVKTQAPANTSAWNYADAAKTPGVSQPAQKPGAQSAKAALPTWADPTSGEYVGRREVARRMAAKPTQPAKPATKALNWTAGTGDYSQTADRGAYGRSTKPVATPSAKIGVDDLDESRMSELDAEYQDYKKLSPREFFNMYRVTKQQWLEKYKSMLPQQGVAEADKKDDEAEPNVRDVVLQRAISRAKADFPTAGSGIEALAKDFMRSQDQDQQSFDQLRQAERKQDQMLGQIAKIDQEQEQEIQDIENQNSTLSSRLQQLQNVNGELEKKLAAMSGRREKRKADKEQTKATAEPTTSKVDVSAPADTDKPAKAEPKATTAKAPNVSYTIKPAQANKKPKLTAKSEPDPGARAFLQMTPALSDNPQASLFHSDYGQDSANMAMQQIRKNALASKNARAQDVPFRDVLDTNISNTDALRKAAYDVGMTENEEDEVDYNNKYQDMVKRMGQKAREQEKSKPVDIADLARRLAAIEASRKD